MAEGQVALLGTGTMGSGMARNLRKAGFPLTVWNRTRAKAEALAETGAQVADTPALAVKGAGVCLSMLADDDASREAWLGTGGALAAMAAGSTIVECGTVSPEWVAELQKAASANGVRLLDAPVTGSKAQAEGGQLTFLVGGDNDALESVTPVLQAMSKSILHLGPVGSGAQLKLINNFLCGVQVAAFAEGMAWLERSGLDRGQALDFLTSGAPGSPVLNAMKDRMTARTYDVNFVLHLMGKDLRYASAAAGAQGVPLTTAQCAEKLFAKAQEAGHGEKDMAAVVEVLRAGSGQSAEKKG